jgi:acyl-CoA thioester hydrolase
MNNVFYEGQVLWAQADANMHLRHSAYADFAAQARLNLLESFGMKPNTILDLKIGPILFREESIYLREVPIGERIRVTCEMTKCRADGSRWSIRHEVYRTDDIKAAIVNVDGAWLDTQQRKLTALPPDLVTLFLQTPRSSDFVEDIPKAK